MNRQDAIYARQSVEKKTACLFPGRWTCAGGWRGRRSRLFTGMRDTPEKTRNARPSGS